MSSALSGRTVAYSEVIHFTRATLKRVPAARQAPGPRSRWGVIGYRDLHSDSVRRVAVAIDQLRVEFRADLLLRVQPSLAQVDSDTKDLLCLAGLLQPEVTLLEGLHCI